MLTFYVIESFVLISVEHKILNKHWNTVYGNNFLVLWLSKNVWYLEVWTLTMLVFPWGRYAMYSSLVQELQKHRGIGSLCLLQAFLLTVPSCTSITCMTVVTSVGTLFYKEYRSWCFLIFRWRFRLHRWLFRSDHQLVVKLVMSNTTWYIHTSKKD